MYASQLTETCQGIVGVLLLILTGIWMIGSGWAAYHHPERTRFWTDATGLWLIKKLYGEEEARRLEQRLRDESRMRRSGVTGMVLGIVFVLGAVVVFLLLALGIR